MTIRKSCNTVTQAIGQRRRIEESRDLTRCCVKIVKEEELGARLGAKAARRDRHALPSLYLLKSRQAASDFPQARCTPSHLKAAYILVYTEQNNFAYLLRELKDPGAKLARNGSSVP